MRNALFIGIGFAILVLQGAFGVLFPLGRWAPNLLLPIVIYLGVAQDVQVVRGAALAFVLGYLLDSFCGSPMGLNTFVMVAVYLIARGAGLNLFMRGPLLQIALTFVFALLAGGSILALRAIFEEPPPFPLDSVLPTFTTMLASAFVTAMTSPFVFLLVRRTDALLSKRPETSAPA